MIAIVKELGKAFWNSVRVIETPIIGADRLQRTRHLAGGP